MNCILRFFQRQHSVSYRQYSSYASQDKTLSLLKKMDKVSVRKKSRRNEVGQKAEASLVFFQVICPGLPGYPGSLFLSTNNKRYLFNCSEGTQRLCVEHCVSRSLASLEHIFLTRKSWRCMGGLGGMCLSIKGSGSPDVTLHGPEGSSKIYEMTKGFICLQDFNVLPLEISSSDIPPYSDSTITIHYLLLNKDNNSPELPSPNPYWKTVYRGYGNDGKLISKFVPEVMDYEVSNSSAVNVVYILKVKGRKGKLNLEKCLDKGVPPGPLLGKLKNGEDVVLENGEKVCSADVKDEDFPDKSFIVIDLPSLEYINELKTASIWDSIREENLLEGIFHFTPSEVFLSEEYQNWMNSFNENVQHHLINDLNSRGYGTLGVATYTEKLSILDPDIFQPLHIDNYFEEGSQSHQNANWIYHRTADRIVVRGNPPELVTTLEPNLSSVVKEELDSLEGWKDVLSRTRDRISKSSTIEESSFPYPKFTFLGTGSSIPSKYRAPSAILVELRPQEYMIMDCGEGTIVQLYRYFGAQKMEEFLKGLKGVYISHLHADHHLGLIGIIKERQRLNLDERYPLYIAAPTKMSSFFNQYHAGFEKILENLVQVRNEHGLILPPGAERQPDEVIHQFKDYLGLESFETCRAVHCINSYCVKFVTNEGFHFLYSGDTRPTPGLVDLAGKNRPDLLIHEATMEHNLLEDAIKKRHSTFTEAINGGIATRARSTILTHFSQRYPKFPILNEMEDHPNVGFAFDFMTVHKGNFNNTHYLMDGLRTLFKEDNELMDARREIFEHKVKSAEALFLGRGQGEEEAGGNEHLKQLYSKLDRPNRKIKRLKLD